MNEHPEENVNLDDYAKKVISSFSLSGGDQIHQAFILKWYVDTGELPSLPTPDLITKIAENEIVTGAFNAIHGSDQSFRELPASKQVEIQLRGAVYKAESIKDRVFPRIATL